MAEAMVEEAANAADVAVEAAAEAAEAALEEEPKRYSWLLDLTGLPDSELLRLARKQVRISWIRYHATCCLHAAPHVCELSAACGVCHVR